MGIVEALDAFADAVYARTGLHWTKDPDWVNPPHWTESIPHLRLDSSDIVSILGLATAFTIGRIYVLRWVLAGGASSKVKKEQTKRKLGESIWKLMYYGTSLVFGLEVASRRNFVWFSDYFSIFDDHRKWWLHSEPMYLDLKWYGLFAIAFYLHSAFCHVVLETRRSDFLEMLLHHVATVVLVTFAYGNRLVEVGVVFLVTHDFSDVLLESAKILNYLEKPLIANGVFVLFVLSWIVFRLYYMATFIVPACYYGSVQYTGHYPFHFLLNTLVAMLQVLHVFWFVMILRLLWRLSRGNNVNDSREEKDDQALPQLLCKVATWSI